MTATDTKAIRDVRKYKLVHSHDYQSQMLVRPDGSWVKHDDYLALCDTVDALRIEVKTLRKQAETLKEGWRISDEGRIDAESENERLQTIRGNLRAVEEKHRETANAQFHRANRLRAENERCRAALMSIERIGIAHSDSFARQIKEAQDIASAALRALAQKGDQP